MDQRGWKKEGEGATFIEYNPLQGFVGEIMMAVFFLLVQEMQVVLKNGEKIPCIKFEVIGSTVVIYQSEQKYSIAADRVDLGLSGAIIEPQSTPSVANEREKTLMDVRIQTIEQKQEYLKTFKIFALENGLSAWAWDIELEEYRMEDSYENRVKWKQRVFLRTFFQQRFNVGDGEWPEFRKFIVSEKSTELEILKAKYQINKQQYESDGPGQLILSNSNYFWQIAKPEDRLFTVKMALVRMGKNQSSPAFNKLAEKVEALVNRVAHFDMGTNSDLITYSLWVLE